jgi:sec-independent protein translocase protein TatB
LFGISGFELVIIAAFALIVLGPDKVPSVARTAGRFIRQFKRTQEEMEAMVRAEMYGEKRESKGLKRDEEPAAVSSAGGASTEFVDDDEDEEEEE